MRPALKIELVEPTVALREGAYPAPPGYAVFAAIPSSPGVLDLSPHEGLVVSAKKEAFMMGPTWEPHIDRELGTEAVSMSFQRVDVPAMIDASQQDEPLVRASFSPFTEVNPHFFVEDGMEDELGEYIEWESLPGFAQLPSEIDESAGATSKVGGFPQGLDESLQFLKCNNCPGGRLLYAVYLRLEFYDLHAWFCPRCGAMTGAIQSV